MLNPKNYRWRKTTDINRENAVFELLADETSILDAGFSDDGAFEIAFNGTIAGLVIDFSRLKELLEAGKKLAELD